MARDNYSYKKYQRELANKKKKEEKRQSKLDKKNMQAKEHLALSDGESAVPDEDPEKTSNGDVPVA